MKRNEEIMKELSSISQVVADIPFRANLSVPDDYFDLLSSQTLLHVAGQSNTFSIPENYFNDLPLQMMQKIASHKGQQMPYQLPDNYFDTVGVQVMDKLKQEQKDRTIIRLFTRWSIAAALTGLLGWGLISIYQSAFQENMLPAELAEAHKIIQQQSFEKELDLLDEKTVVNYLNQTGHDLESALVASFTEEYNNLPNAEDYMLDESTLNNYLDKANIFEFNNTKN